LSRLATATLTHHLNAMEASGLLVRRRDPVNQRVHVVELTDAGDAMFHQLRKSVGAFDKRLRAGLSEDDVGQLERLLDVLQATSVGDPRMRSGRRSGSRSA